MKTLGPIVTLAFLSAFFVIPVGGLLWTTTQRTEILSNLLDPTVLAIVRFTLWQASLSTIASALMGGLLALWIWKQKGAADSITQGLLLMPFGIPSLVACFAWLMILPQDLKYSLTAIVIAHGFFNIPLFAASLLSRMSQIPSSEILSLQMLGGRWGQCLRWIVWPHCRVQILSTSLQIFSLCASSFAIVLVLGGGPPYQTLETSILFRIRSGVPDWNAALALGLWQIAITVIPWIMISWLGRPAIQSLVPRSTPDAKSPRLLGLRFLAGLFTMVYGLPFLVSTNWIDELTYLGSSEFGRALAQSLGLALSVTVLVISLCLAVLMTLRPHKSKFFDSLILAAGSLSPLTLGLALWLCYARWIDPFEGSFLFLCALQTLLLLPFAYRWLKPLQSLNPVTELLAVRSLGATAGQSFWWVIWPRWKRPLLSCAALLVTASIGEVATVSLFYTEKFSPLSLQLSRMMGQYQFARAELLTLILVLICGLLSFAAARSAKTP